MTITLLALLMTFTLVFEPGAEGSDLKVYHGNDSALGMELGNLRAMNDQLNASFNALEEKLQTMNDNLKSAVNELQGNFQAMKTRIDIIDQRANFLATFDSSEVAIGRGGVVFNRVLANNGGGYNSSTGVFTAPQRGLYVFTARAISRKHYFAIWEMMVNGKSAMISMPLIDQDLYYQFVYPVELQAGDRVSINSIGTFNGYGNFHSFFGGWLVNAF